MICLKNNYNTLKMTETEGHIYIYKLEFHKTIESLSECSFMYCLVLIIVTNIATNNYLTAGHW